MVVGKHHQFYIRLLQLICSCQNKESEQNWPCERVCGWKGLMRIQTHWQSFCNNLRYRLRWQKNPWGLVGRGRMDGWMKGEWKHGWCPLNRRAVTFKINVRTDLDHCRGNWIEELRFGLVSLFNGISTFVGYLMQKLFSWKNSSGTI